MQDAVPCLQDAIRRHTGQGGAKQDILQQQQDIVAEMQDISK
jgi:hypothetical protein